MMIGRIELGTPTGHETINPTTSTGITAALITPTTGDFTGISAVAALITVETFQVRFRMDGAPTADLGHIIAATKSYVVIGGTNIKALRFIDTSDGASDVMVTVFH